MFKLSIDLFNEGLHLGDCPDSVTVGQFSVHSCEGNPFLTFIIHCEQIFDIYFKLGVSKNGYPKMDGL